MYFSVLIRFFLFRHLPAFALRSKFGGQTRVWPRIVSSVGYRYQCGTWISMDLFVFRPAIVSTGIPARNACLAKEGTRICSCGSGDIRSVPNSSNLDNTHPLVTALQREKSHASRMVSSFTTPLPLPPELSRSKASCTKCRRDSDRPPARTNRVNFFRLI